MTQAQKVLALVYDELIKATQKFGPFTSNHEGYAIILEELDEAWDEIKTNNTSRATAEMIQVGAMAVRWLLSCSDCGDINTRYDKLDAYFKEGKNE